jgi:catechol 2,3-dioxygenase-like lactoylglutathione lyase family enzyme
MIKKASHIGLWVHDQDEALAFYTEKLGFEVREDVTLSDFGNYRWLTVGAPGDDLVFILSIPSASPLTKDIAAEVLDLTAKGAAPGGILEVDDCRATVDELTARGVEFTQEPVEHFYGIDAAFRDPSGNEFRVVERKEYDRSKL